MIRHYVCYGWSYIDNYDFDSAGHAFKKSMELAVQIRDTASMLLAVSQIARSHRLDGEYLDAARYSLEHIRLAKLQNDTMKIISSYILLGNLYSMTGAYEKQVELSKIIFNLARSIADSSLQYWFNGIASDYYSKTAQYDSALYYTRLNLPKTRNFRSIPTVWLTMGTLFVHTNQLDSASYYYKAFNEAALRANMQIDPDTYLAFGIYEFKKGNVKKALEYFKKAESALEEKNIMAKLRTYGALHEYYDSTKNITLSLAYFKKYKTIEDSIQRQRDAFNDGIVEMLTESQKLEDQVQLLTQNNVLQKKLNSKQIQQRNTLYGCAGFVIVFAGFGFSRYRKNKNNKARQALLNERLRISRDLHDEVGATLSGIAMYSHVAKEQMKNSDNLEAEHSLDIMQKSAGEMVTKLSDIVWLINPDQDTIQQLLDRLEEYAKQMASANNLVIKTDISPTISDFHLPLEARRNIYLFCKEAINNAVKYSKGQVIELQVLEETDSLHFSVIDDGIGFDELTVKRGNGIGNMKTRAEEIGALFLLKSKSGSGTRIELQYELSS